MMNESKSSNVTENKTNRAIIEGCLPQIVTIAIALSSDVDDLENRLVELKDKILDFKDSAVEQNQTLRSVIEQKNPSLYAGITNFVIGTLYSRRNGDKLVKNRNYNFNETELLDNILEPVSVSNPDNIELGEYDIPLGNLARISILKGGNKRLEQIRNKLQQIQEQNSKIIPLISKRVFDLYEIIATLSNKDVFVENFVKNYVNVPIDKIIRDEKTGICAGEITEEQIVEKEVKESEWEEDEGTHIRELVTRTSTIKEVVKVPTGKFTRF